MLMSENNTALPSVTVDICESTSHQNAESKDASSPLSYFPRISMSKGLFISLSCPSGLNKHLENDESLSSLTTSDSALEDDATTSNDEEDCEDVSISVPNLKGKIPKTIGLLEYVQSKQFIKRTTSLKLTNHQMWTNDVNQKQNSNSLSNNVILSNDNKIVSAEETFLNETKNDRTKPLNCEDGNSIDIKAQTHNNKPVVRKLDYSDEQTKNLLTKVQE
uniref:Uncharacterized protein n=1 Tax=Ciona savignyi TaxID=51511 RepID=H2ZE98_CIOSA